MIQFGTQITRTGDQLQKITVERLFQGISRPKQEFRDLIEQLRMVQSMDESRYKELKKQLPYFVCGIFHPPIRRKEHFGAIEYFMLDLDRLAAGELDKSVLKAQLKTLPEVVLLFESPSADGLKLMFRLSEKCSDTALFSAFYKLFAHRFAEKYGLANVVDFQTSDVTRACFMSFDPEAYYNEHAQLIEIQQFLPDFNFDKAEKDIKETERALQTISLERKIMSSPDEDTLLKIKQKLNPHYLQPKEKQYFVPKQLEDAVPMINDQLAEFEMRLLETQPISYGRKMKIACKELWAEINVFYGKEGFKVVKTTKTGSHPELATLAAQVLEQILATIPTTKQQGFLNSGE